ncbi:dTDP-4-dehydrorhamnose 3,5-epimerase [Aestuariivirga sp.]|uniref:dTDP-4-dehydrorhamnose 3,5-epimerase n=1 Tax=Aestuariivirga sp. TaxID=2650926 RepID=UPI0039E3A187
MQVRDLGMGVLEVVPKKFGDARGFFSETFQRQRFTDAGITQDWMQDNQSYSAEKGVLRGLHFQVAPDAQDKLIRVLKGSIFDVAVDIRKASPTYRTWVSCILSAEKFNQLLIPKGFAHGFVTLEPDVEVLYKVSAPYSPSCDRGIRWNDPTIGIEWPLDPGQQPVLSAKDAAAPLLAEAEKDIVF